MSCECTLFVMCKICKQKDDEDSLRFLEEVEEE